jgi:ADP-L-glycero-D-manno-heptose 6-epimerase
MKLFVTGSRGFIGTNFIREAKHRNIPLQSYDPLGSSGLKKVSHLDMDDDITHVIHLGAISSTTETNIRRVLEHNLTWSIELFEYCAERGIHFQWASSAAVYGPRSKSDGPFQVTDECRPSNPYAMSKYLLEQYITKRNTNITTQGFRYFNVYGPNEDHKGTQASPYTQFETQAKETGVIKIFEGSNRIYRDFVHVDIVVQRHFDMMEKPVSGIFNVGSGQTRTFLDVAIGIAAKHKARIEIIPFPEHLMSHYQYYTCAG